MVILSLFAIFGLNSCEVFIAMSEEYELVLSANYGRIPSYLWGVVV